MTPPALIPAGVPLSRVAGLTPAQITTLSHSWIVTAQEFVAIATCHESCRVAMTQALGVNAAGLDGLVQAAQTTLPVTGAPALGLAPAVLAARYSLGAILEDPATVDAHHATLPLYAPPGLAESLPASVSHLDELPPVRDQGSRGTCVAHAVAAVREHLEIRAGAAKDLNLSEQFIYWWCKQHDGIQRTGGTYPATGMACLQQVGAPLEDAWPYVPAQGDNEGQGPPPAAIANGDPAFRTIRTIELNRGDINGVKVCLHEGRLVAFAVPVYGSWYYSDATQRWGKIIPPLPGEPSVGGHCMTLVGYQDDPDAPGGGYFLVRNSWQPWSYEGVWQPGYGYIAYDYITRYAQALLSAERAIETRLFMRDSAADTGTRPLNETTWNSPDLWLRQQANDLADGDTTCQPPRPGQPNAIFVRPASGGPAYAYGAHAEVFVAPLAPVVSSGAWQQIGEVSAGSIPPIGEPSAAAVAAASCAWTPPAAVSTGAGDLQGYALQVRLAGAVDPFDPARNASIGQRNLGFLLLHPGATGQIAFTATGMKGSLDPVSFRVERGDLPAEVVIGPLMAQKIEEAAPPGTARGLLDDLLLGALTGAIMLLSGEQRRISLTVTLPAAAQPGQRYTMTIDQLQGDAVLGRLTVEVQVVAG
jgi:hypothetical protein